MPLKDPVARAAYQKEWTRKNKEKRERSAEAYRNNHREVLRGRTIKSRYGISHDEYKKLFIVNPVCELCNKRKSVHLDHDHETGKIRGVLCQPCNTGLGKLGDNIEGLEIALKYLKERV